MGVVLILEDVQPCRCDVARLKCLHEGLFVNDGTTGGIDEDSGRLHQCQLPLSDEVVRLGAVGCVNRDEVGAEEEIIQWGICDPLASLIVCTQWGALVVEDLHAEGASALSDG